MRGVDTAGRSQRQVLGALRAQDDRKPVQPELIDFTYASASESAAESQTDCERSDDESDEPPPRPKQARRVTFAEPPKPKKRRLRKK